MITWEQMLEFVGMKAIPSDNPNYKFKIIRIFNGQPTGGLVSYGNTIESAASRQNINWTSVRNKISNLEWERMAHL
jgi:hypothetical protein